MGSTTITGPNSSSLRAALLRPGLSRSLTLHKIRLSIRNLRKKDLSPTSGIEPKNGSVRPFQTGAPSEASAPLEYSVDPAIIDTYLKLLEVEPILATRLVTVSFSLPDPSLAARVANAHVHDFVKQELEIHSSAQRAAGEFLKSQLTVIGKRVEQAEAALNAYRQHNGVLSFDVEDRNKVVAERMSLLTRALTDAETKRITAQSLLELVQHGDYDSLPQVVNNPTISALKPQLISLETEYARLSAAFNPALSKDGGT